MATPPLPDSDTASTTGSIHSLKLERKDSSLSLTKLQTSAQPAVSMPSPIPESPIREAADPAPAPQKGPSPLSGEVISAEGTESLAVLLLHCLFPTLHLKKFQYLPLPSPCQL